METKGGSIQSIQLHDLTGFGALDLAVGDCDGVVTLFSRQQILSKHDLGAGITDITIHSDLGTVAVQFLFLFIFSNAFDSGWM